MNKLLFFSIKFVIYGVGLIPSKFMKDLVDRDDSEFGRHLIIAVVLLLVNAAAISVNKWLETRLYISFRAEITRKILTLYYSKVNI